MNKSISHNFSSPYTPQQGDVLERRNRSLCECVRTMLSFTNIPSYFSVEAIRVVCPTQNSSYINKRF